MLEQLAGVRRHPLVAAAPQLHLAADVVDQRVADPPFAGDLEVEGLLLARLPTHAGRRHRNERLARPPAGKHFAGRPLRSDLEVS